MFDPDRFLSSTGPIDRFDNLPHHQQQHAKAHVTWLIAATNKTNDGIARHVMPSNGERALLKYFGEYVWGEGTLTLERLEEL